MVVSAHSGGTMGLNSHFADNAFGEVPISWPTIAQQAATFVDHPESIDLLLLNGGINNIDIRVILNPSTNPQDLTEDIETFCYIAMKQLLTDLLDRFPAAKIVLTGYYPILSPESDLNRILPFLDILGIGHPSSWPTKLLLQKIFELSPPFWRESDASVARAVQDVRTPDRVKSVRLPFTVANAVSATQPLLFGLKPITLEPEDEVVGERKIACNLYFNAPLEWPSLFQCYHASAGHPNVQGAQLISKSILAALRT
jgi:hypothetical protein